MDTDLAVLSRRVAQLERVIGTRPGDTGEASNVLSELKEAATILGNVVPDELVAAQRVVHTLQQAVSALSSATWAKRTNAANAERIVSEAARDLEQMDALSESLQGAGVKLNDILEERDGVVRLESLKNNAVAATDKQSESVELLLLDYNAAIATLNSRITRMASAISALETVDGDKDATAPPL